MSWFAKKSKPRARYRVTSVPVGRGIDSNIYSLFQWESFGRYWSFRLCSADERIGKAWIENIKTSGFYEKVEVES